MTNKKDVRDQERDDDGMTDAAASAVQDVVEDLLNIDDDKDPTPGPPATSRG